MQANPWLEHSSQVPGWNLSWVSREAHFNPRDVWCTTGHCPALGLGHVRTSRWIGPSRDLESSLRFDMWGIPPKRWVVCATETLVFQALQSCCLMLLPFLVYGWLLTLAKRRFYNVKLLLATDMVFPKSMKSRNSGPHQFRTLTKN